jgi:hypothetical protein
LVSSSGNTFAVARQPLGCFFVVAGYVQWFILTPRFYGGRNDASNLKERNGHFATVCSQNCIGSELHGSTLERVDCGEMNLQLEANEKNQDRAQCGKNEAGGMITLVCRGAKTCG